MLLLGCSYDALSVLLLLLQLLLLFCACAKCGDINWSPVVLFCHPPPPSQKQQSKSVYRALKGNMGPRTGFGGVKYTIFNYSKEPPKTLFYLLRPLHYAWYVGWPSVSLLI